jgi:hypothetical protein
MVLLARRDASRWIAMALPLVLVTLLLGLGVLSAIVCSGPRRVTAVRLSVRLIGLIGELARAQDRGEEA